MFTIKSCYSLFDSDSSTAVVLSGVLGALKHCWNSAALNKLQHFGWRLLHDKIPSKDQLFKHGILTDVTQLRCIFCPNDDTVMHLLGTCSFADNIRRNVYDWIGTLGEMRLEEFKSFFFKCEKVLNKLKQRVVSFIWLVSVWSIWLMRNIVIFNYVNPSFDECMLAIMYKSWIWLSSSCKIVDCSNFYTTFFFVLRRVVFVLVLSFGAPFCSL